MSGRSTRGVDGEFAELVVGLGEEVRRVRTSCESIRVIQY